MLGRLIVNNQAYVAGRLTASAAVGLRFRAAGAGVSTAAFVGGGVRALNNVVSQMETSGIDVASLSDTTLADVFSAGGVGATVNFNAESGDLTATLRVVTTDSRMPRTNTVIICNVNRGC